MYLLCRSMPKCRPPTQRLPLRRSGAPAARSVPGEWARKSTGQSAFREHGGPLGPQSIATGCTRRPIDSDDPDKAEPHPERQPRNTRHTQLFLLLARPNPADRLPARLGNLRIARTAPHMLHTTIRTSWLPRPSSCLLPTHSSPRSSPSHLPCGNSPPPYPPQMARHDYHGQRASQLRRPSPRRLPPWTWLSN